MRAKISIDAQYYVTLETDNISGEREKTTYYVPKLSNDAPAMIRFYYTGSNDDPIVCDRLYLHGASLMATHQTLLAVIRREHKRRMAKLKREFKAWDKS